MRLRCPNCGGRRAFLRGWFRTVPRCRTCGLAWRRGQVGFELGAAAINAMFTIGLLLVAMAVGIAITLPDIDVVPLLIVLGALAIVIPIVLYPFTYTVWFAIGLLMERPSDKEVSEAEAHIAGE